MNIKYLIIALIVLQSCAQKPWYGDLTFLGRFPNKLSEVSGLDKDGKGNLWVIEDNGNKDKLFQINEKAQIVKELKIENAKNADWEDLTIAKDGTVYIGDFGNNFNQRQDLVIYKIPKQQLKKKTPKAEKIKFSYPEQKEFPPTKDGFFFDSEGFFHWNGYLYVFTKNRTRPYDGRTFIYRIPDRPGNHEAELLGDIVLCKEKDHCSVTGADISSDGKLVALIGYGYVYLLKDFEHASMHKATVEPIYIVYETQIEAVCFSDDSTLLIADEQSKTKGRNLYRYSLKD